MNTTTTPSLLSLCRQEVARRLGDTLPALHIETAAVGLFFTGVQLSNGAAGMCATPIKSIPAAVCCPSSAAAMPTPGKIRGRLAADLLDDLERPQPLRRALSIAVLNALVETLWQRDGAPQVRAMHDGDAYDALAIQPGDRVALVGAFPPYIRDLRKRGIDFRILELDTSTLKPDEMPYYAHPDTAPQVIPECNVLVSTATTLINDTLDGLLRHIQPGTRVGVIGPTAPLLPSPFAQRGVTVLGGTRVTDGQTLLPLLAEGASGYHFFEKSVQRITLEL